MATSAAFDPGQFPRSYDFLGDLPESLHDASVLASDGTLEERVTGLLAWRKALLEGHVPGPTEVAWPAAPVRTLLRDELSRLELPRFCRGNEEVTDALLLQLVALGEQLSSRRERAIEDLIAALRAEEQRRAGAAKEAKSTRRKAPDAALVARRAFGSVFGGSVAASGSDEKPVHPALQGIVDGALAEAARLAAGHVRTGLDAQWAARVKVWAEIESVFGELGQLIGIGWDLSRGVLRSQGWLEAARLAKLLEQLPALRDLVRTLGRLHDTEGRDESVLEQIFEPTTRVAEELQEVRSPFAPHETRGVERSDAISRMLPAEAMLLRRKSLRLLWHARRAEHALLTYRVEGMEFERVPVERVGEELVSRAKAKRERGPIVLCVDTSGSMQGLPEQVAKAVALEACRTAHREGRKCLLYAFSGPGDVVEHELTLDERGLQRLLSFLSFTFGGGTDVAGPLVRAAARLKSEDWSRADVVIVSDGEFPVPTVAAAALREALDERGARFHGILIGNGHSAALQALCDPVHVFASWAGLAGGTRSR